MSTMGNLIWLVAAVLFAFYVVGNCNDAKRRHDEWQQHLWCSR